MNPSSSLPGRISPQQRPFPTMPQASESGSHEAPSSFAQHQVSISGLSKALVLKCLWDNGEGAGEALEASPDAQMNTSIRQKMDIKVAEQHIQESRSSTRSLWFDYFESRPIKTDIGGEYIDTEIYDKIHGDDSGKRAIERAVEMTRELEFKEKNSEQYQRLNLFLNNHSGLEELTNDQLLALACYVSGDIESIQYETTKSSQSGKRRSRTFVDEVFLETGEITLACRRVRSKAFQSAVKQGFSKKKARAKGALAANKKRAELISASKPTRSSVTELKKLAQS